MGLNLRNMNILLVSFVQKVIQLLGSPFVSREDGMLPGDGVEFLHRGESAIWKSFFEKVLLSLA